MLIVSLKRVCKGLQLQLVALYRRLSKMLVITGPSYELFEEGRLEKERCNGCPSRQAERSFDDAIMIVRMPFMQKLLR